MKPVAIASLAFVFEQTYRSNTEHPPSCSHVELEDQILKHHEVTREVPVPTADPFLLESPSDSCRTSCSILIISDVLSLIKRG